MQSADLEAVVDGYLNSPDSRRPCIYVIELADEVGGGGLRIWHMERIIKHARAYLQERDDNFAIRIHKKLRGDADAPEEELLINAQLKRGERPFFKSDQMKRSMLRMCDYIEEELRKLRANGAGDNDRMPYALRHIGYAIDGSNRLKNHDSHRSTNPLLAMFALIAKADPKLHGCVVHDYIFFRCWRQLHGSVGEIIFSLLAQSYIETGRGFNSSPTGISTSSVGKQDIEFKWAKWLNGVLVRSNFKANLQEELERIADNKRQLKRAKEELQQYKLREIAEKKRMVRLYLSVKQAMARLEALKLQLAQETEQRGIGRQGEAPEDDAMEVEYSQQP